LREFCGNNAKLLAELDKDGDGKISIEEVLEGIRAKQASDKGRKILAWSLGGAVTAFVIILAAFAGILHLQFQANKDTELASSGTMMVKRPEATLPVEVSMKAHGEIFTPSNSITDETGAERKCVSAGTARKMFESATKGTNAKFVETNSASGAVDVVNMEGSGSCNADGSEPYAASWNNEEIKLGSMSLVPNVECTAAGNTGSGRRHLSQSDIMERHRELRDFVVHTFIEGKDGGDVNDETSMNHMGRRLQDSEEATVIGYLVDAGAILGADCTNPDGSPLTCDPIDGHVAIPIDRSTFDTLTADFSETDRVNFVQNLSDLGIGLPAESCDCVQAERTRVEESWMGWTGARQSGFITNLMKLGIIPENVPALNMGERNRLLKMLS